MCLPAPRRRAPPPTHKGKSPSSFSSSGSSAGSDPPPSPRKHRRRGSISASRSTTANEGPAACAEIVDQEKLKGWVYGWKYKWEYSGGANTVASAESAVVDERAGLIKVSPGESNDRARGKVANNVYPLSKEYPYPKSHKAVVVVTTQVFLAK
ncbi:unnamed protein product [Tuber aestivum]|uniref:Uncharacterized protein n=1 Tax=Tuber aestivum TaxID=59557 RepID=A0A292PZF0_9PEZI|nr:unnamed protein product [Tuber aestivum]